MPPTDPNDGPSVLDDGPQRARRMELRRKVSLKFKEFQGFINEYSENISASGMFIRTPSPQPPGTVFDFELTLRDDYRLVHGIGEVVWVREADEGFDQPAGMGVRFLSLDSESRKLIDRMVEERLDRDARKAAATPPDAAEPWGEMAPPPELSWTTAPGREGAGIASAEPSGAPEGPGDAEAGRGPEAGPRPPGPSPYAYARSYRGAGVARPSPRRRPLVVVLLVAVFVVAVLAAAVLFFPDPAMEWLLGGDGVRQEGLVERPRPEEEAEPPGEPVTPVPRSEAEGVLGPAEPRGPGAGDAAAAPDRPEEGDAAEVGPGELGFFEPPPERPAAEERRPSPGPEPAPEPGAPAESSPSPAASAPADFSRVLNVVWEERGEALVVTVHLDGAIEEWDYSITRIEAPPPRELVRIEGIEQPFPRPAIPVGTELVERIRIGFHPDARGSQLHVVLDLATPEARIDRSEAAGNELHLHVVRGDE